MPIMIKSVLVSPKEEVRAMQIVVWKIQRSYSKRHLSQDGFRTLCGTPLDQFDTLTHRDFIANDRVTCRECGDILQSSDHFTARSKELLAA
jgi:hypothetical protein